MAGVLIDDQQSQTKPLHHFQTTPPFICSNVEMLIQTVQTLIGSILLYECESLILIAQTERGIQDYEHILQDNSAHMILGAQTKCLRKRQN